MNRVPPEVPANRSLGCLAPRFRDAVNRMLAAHRDAGHDPMIRETCRTTARQRFLYGFGREYDDDRGIVTNSINADHTWHGFGLAVDIVSAKLGDDAPDAFWNDLGVAARDEGLAWGGDWPRFPDRPHVQWGKPMLRSPSWRAPGIRDKQGVEAVWREVGAV